MVCLHFIRDDFTEFNITVTAGCRVAREVARIARARLVGEMCAAGAWRQIIGELIHLWFGGLFDFSRRGGEGLGGEP